MSTPKFYIAVLTLTLLTSCSRTHTLSGEDLTWMPYSGNEILVFNSTTGDTDTIFNLKKDTLWGYPDPTLGTSKYQVVRIFCRHTDKTNGNDYRYLDNDLVRLNAKDGIPKLYFNLNTKSATFYKLTGISIDSLRKERPTMLQTKRKIYRDIYIVDDEDWLNFKQRNDYVTKFYWSKSEGIIRYDKQDGTYWELMNKYGP